MKKRLFLFLCCLFLSMGMAVAQVTAGGVVLSAEGNEPIIGATVKVQGTSTGTITGLDGKFSIKVAKLGVKLEISSVGMHSQVVKAAQNMKIVLQENANALDEVMVVAYGTQKKSAFTGSAAVVGSTELQKHVTTNVADALVGSVAGLQIRGGSGAPGASQGSIKIRGIASMYAGQDPLIIVDGAPYPASLSNIKQDDIESISVLKDAASAALYGARGAAGVIIVTTKKGSAYKSEIKFDAKMGANSRSVQDYDVITNPGEYYEAYYKGLYNRNFYGLGMSADQANTVSNSTMLKELAYNVFTCPEGELLIGADGKLNPKATLGRLHDYNGTTYYMTPDNWTDLAYKTALRQEYNVSVNGGTNRSSFYASLGYLNEDGIIDNSGYERISARVKADYMATKWMKLGANVSYGHSTILSNPNLSTDYGSTNIMYYTSMMAPIYPAYVRIKDANGNIVIKKSQYGNDVYDYGVAATGYGVTRPFLASGNPLGSNRYNKFETVGDQLNGTFTADFTLTSYLKANVTSTVIVGHTNYSKYNNQLEGPQAASGGALSKEAVTNMRTNNVQSVQYFNDFGKHNVTAMVGHEYYRTSSNNLFGEMRGGFSPDILELNAFATMNQIKSSRSDYNVEGFFGSAQYNYDGKYFGSASFRRDASSRFAKENRWGNFWSVGGAWILSKESFLKEVAWIDMLKLKASIGQQGNDNIGSYAFIDTYYLTKASEQGMSPNFNRMGNPDITWETTTNFNIGTEFSFLKGRLSGSLDFYTKKTSDLLFWLSIPESAGTRGYYGNVGDIRNTGVELALTGVLVKTKDIDWSVTANLSHNKTKILKLPETKIADNGGFSESTAGKVYQNWFEVGGELYVPFMVEYAGVNEHGEALYWVDKDAGPTNAKPGQKHSYTTTDYSQATRYKQKSVLPDMFGGFSTTLRVGNFDVSASFDFQIGGKVYDIRYSTLMVPSALGGSGAGQNFHKDYAKAWSTNNTSSDIPRWQVGDQYTNAKSTRWLTNASYLNFQSFTVGYTVPKKWLQNMASVRIYVAGENLGFWSARKGLDPRYSFEGNTSGTSVYSPVRNVSGGIQVTF